MDEENKIGTQLQKRILDNLVFNGDYTIGSTVRKGKTGDYSYDGSGVLSIIRCYFLLTQMMRCIVCWLIGVLLLMTVILNILQLKLTVVSEMLSVLILI